MPPVAAMQPGVPGHGALGCSQSRDEVSEETQRVGERGVWAWREERLVGQASDRMAERDQIIGFRDHEVLLARCLHELRESFEALGLHRGRRFRKQDELRVRVRKTPYCDAARVDPRVNVS